MEIQVKL